MRDEGVGSWPLRRARLGPDKVAITFRDQQRTYAELDHWVTRLAHALRALGIRAGDRVALLSRNHPAYIEVLFASARLGAIFVPLNARLTAAEVGFCLADSGTSVLFHSAEVAETAMAAIERSAPINRVVLDGEPDANANGYEDRIANADASPIDEPVVHDDACMIMYTSGTTGRPKGVVLTHGNVVFSAMNAIIDLDLARDEVALVCAPLFHTAALDFVALPTLLKGGTVHIEEGFEAGRILRVLERHGVTYTFGVPTMFDALSAHPDWTTTDLSSIRRVIVAAAPVPARTLRTYTDRGVSICQAYGLTETGPGALILTPENVRRKLGTAGVAHTFTDVRVVDPDANPVSSGERGEIQVRGPNVMREYWNRADATAEAFTEDGWFRSGDVGLVDDEGFIAIVDRMKDMIISGGENIYPAEVESAILEMPGIAECAVFGVADERWGEVGRAAIVLEANSILSEDELLTGLRENLAAYKIPKSLVFVDEIPRNAAGKIRKNELRARYAV